jgi:ribonuclease D
MARTAKGVGPATKAAPHSVHRDQKLGVGGGGAKNRRGGADQKKPRANAKDKAAAAAAAKEDTRLVISKEYIESLPRRQWDGEIKLLHTKEEMQAAVTDILQTYDESGGAGSCCCLGFDIESKPAFRKGEFNPPALLQIATSTTVYLFRLSALHDHQGPKRKGKNAKKPTKANEATFALLRPLLTDSRFIKAGVGVAHDVTNLKSLLHFSPGGFCELADLARSSLRSLSLQALGAHYLQCHVPKSKSVTMSDWASTKPLSDAQIKYAATDAWLGRAIWLAMQQEEEEPKNEKEDGRQIGKNIPRTTITTRQSSKLK